MDKGLQPISMARGYRFQRCARARRRRDSACFRTRRVVRKCHDDGFVRTFVF